MVVSLAAVAASCTASTKSVTAPLSRKVFTASLVEVDALRIVFAAFLIASAASSALLVKFLSCNTFLFF
jgi:hypothetical protein